MAVSAESSANSTPISLAFISSASQGCSAAGFEYLEIDAEPNAEGFYRKTGAQRIGETPSGSIPGRTLPLMRVRVPTAPCRR
jgi:hypothetical protein